MWCGQFRAAVAQVVGRSSTNQKVCGLIASSFCPCVVVTVNKIQNPELSLMYPLDCECVNFR